jgi:cysteine desulfurase
MFKRKKIYLDYASLTPIDKRVAREVKKYSKNKYSNPSSWYKSGVEAKDAIERARAVVAQYIHAHNDEIFFTSGGTEANNIAILGVVRKLCEQNVDYKDMHIIVSAIEHSSIIETVKYLQRLGVEIDYALVDHSGTVSPEEIKKLLKEKTVLVSIMTVNNEVGTIQPIKDIYKIVRQYREHSCFGKDRNCHPKKIVSSVLYLQWLKYR